MTSALARHELIDDIPAAHDLAIPRGGYRPRLAAPRTWHAFDADTCDIERDQIVIEGTGLSIAIYPAARSIVDAFRMRRLEGYETPITALRLWLSQRGNHPAELLSIAQRPPRA